MQLERTHVSPQPQPLRLPHVLTDAEKYRRILANHLPGEAVEWVYGYLNRHRVHFHITRQRTSKLGDYRWPQPRHDYHEISVNGDLNPYRFLLVFLHEAAHLETHLKYTHVPPHGHEWQGEYARLIADHTNLFPPEVQPLLLRLVTRIPLSRTLMKEVEKQLHHYDADYDPSAHLTLDDLPAGTHFRLKSNPTLELASVEHRRTRWLCVVPGTRRFYTVSGTAEVIPAAE